MSEENRTIDQFGPQCVLETGSCKVGTCGVASFVFHQVLLISGILFSIFLTLIITPFFFSLIDKEINEN